ncbi:MAG: sugar phosphate nucleotidyltransferase [Nitrospinaceae bacterium]
MKAMVFAAGFGARLRPLTLSLPKPLFPLLGRPVMEHLLLALAGQGIREAAVNLHHLPGLIKDHFGDGENLGLTLHYSHEPAILGTAGGLLAAQRFLGDSPFLVLNSDIVTAIDFQRLLAFHRERRAALTLVLCDRPGGGHDPIEVDAQGRVVHLTGASSRHIPEITSRFTFTGIQVVDPLIFDRIPVGRFCGTTADVYPEMIDDGLPVHAYIHDGYWQDMGTLHQYLQVHKDLLDGKFNLPSALPAAAFPEDQTTAPVWLGTDCRVAPGARIGPYAVLGKGCVLEADCVVENAVLWDHVHVGRGASIRQSVVAQGVRVEAGQTVTNASMVRA